MTVVKRDEFADVESSPLFYVICPVAINSSALYIECVRNILSPLETLALVASFHLLCFYNSDMGSVRFDFEVSSVLYQALVDWL